MSLIWTAGGPYRRVSYGSEADLEAAILEVQAELFGPDRIYLDIKKKIGAKGGNSIVFSPDSIQRVCSYSLALHSIHDFRKWLVPQYSICR